MKILLVHNYYGSSAPSGENKVFDVEKAMLEKHGHTVALYTRHSDEIREGSLVKRLFGKFKGACCTMGNPFAARAIVKICREFKPDVVHFHNVFPLISPLAIRAASKHAPVVMTLHNYRTACAAGVPTRDGKVCSLCIEQKCIRAGIKHRCYRGSLFATLPLAINIALYRKSIPQWISMFVVFSEFQKRKMEGYGFPSHKFSIKPNFITGIKSLPEEVSKTKDIVYVGRLSPEKGIGTLIRAWALIESKVDCRLVLIGDGDFRAEYEKQANGLKIQFLGKKLNDEVRKILARSKAVVLPSECWEGMPITLLESFSEGTPCIVSNVGALPEYAHGGRLGEIFEAGNERSLADAIERMLARTDYDKMCAAAQKEARERYSEDGNYRCLMDIYERAMAEQKHRQQ